MFGNGVGSLRVWFRPVDASDENPPRILWEMSGDSGNNWYMAQLPIASAVNFQIAFEGIVGSNYLGNIAIDSISLEAGSCPSKTILSRFSSPFARLPSRNTNETAVSLKSRYFSSQVVAGVQGVSWKKGFYCHSQAPTAAAAREVTRETQDAI